MPLQDQIQAFLASGPFAVVGASPDRAKYGNKVLRCYRQHGLEAFPIHPREAEVEGLKAYLGRSTLVLATHRVFVAELCERVLVLEEGRAAQLGTPEDLAARPGLFARLKRLQSLERELVQGRGGLSS